MQSAWLVQLVDSQGVATALPANLQFIGQLQGKQHVPLYISTTSGGTLGAIYSLSNAGPYQARLPKDFCPGIL